MTDEQSFGEHGSAVPASWSTPQHPTQSIAEPVLSGDYAAIEPPEAPEVPPISNKLPWFAAVVGAVTLLIGGGFFALTAFGSSGGADTPEEAVDALIAAANDEDFIAMAAMLEPSERRMFTEPLITDVVPELVRLGVLDDSVDVGNVDGLDWDFTDVTYRVEPVALNADMARVYFTGGEAAAEFVAAEFPFGDKVREHFGGDLGDEPRVTEQIEETETPIVLVEREGRWYVSAMFTIAEAARIDAGEEMPDATQVPRALGSQTPEAAVEAMFAEMIELDLAGLIGRLDPEEMAVFYRYAPLFLDEGQEGLDELANTLTENNMQWDLSDFDFDVETDGADAAVIVRGFRLEVTSETVDVSFTYGRDHIVGEIDAGDLGRGSVDATPTRWVIQGAVEEEVVDVEVNINNEAKSVEASGEFSGKAFSGSITFDETGVCSRYSVTADDGTQETGCLEEGLRDGLATEQFIGLLDGFGDEFEGMTMAARRTNGEWYVSPVTSMFDYYINSLKNLDDGDFDELLESMSSVPMYGLGAAGMFGALGSDYDYDDFEGIELDSPAFAVGSVDEGSVDGGFGSSEAVLDTSMPLLVAPDMTLTLDGRVEPGTFDQAIVEMTADDLLTVIVEAGDGTDLDMTVEVVGPQGSIAFNDDADEQAGIGPFDSKVEVRVPSDGTYTIEIRSLGDVGSGDYTVTVQRS